MNTTLPKKLAHYIASACAAERRCNKHNNSFADRWDDLLTLIEKNLLPHGSGIDCGCKIVREKCDDSRITIEFSYHHMNENGVYVGWSEYRVTARPGLEIDLSLTITGQDRNGLKEYFADLFLATLLTQYRHTDQNELIR